MIEIFEEIYRGLLSLTLLEGLAVIFSFSSTILLIFNSVLVFPFTIVGSTLYIGICYRTGIYADIFVSIYFIITSIMGWYHWSKGLWNTEPPIIDKTKSRDWRFLLFSFLIFYVILFFFLKGFTNSNVVAIDALTTDLSFLATILMVKRKIENWIIWIIAVILSIPLYFYKQLYLTSIFYLFTLFMNFVGYYKWSIQLKAQNQ
ncbi:MAG: nicotinamide mononucleotide transporter [Sphingobacteriales bacterium]|nr:nicotinamide mononucleotide transporter [Sphingobacteriales bacterium]